MAIIEQGTSVGDAKAPARTLTDADVDAITARLESRLSDRVVRSAGVGVLQLAKRGLFWALVALAVYGIVHGLRS